MKHSGGVLALRLSKTPGQHFSRRAPNEVPSHCESDAKCFSASTILLRGTDISRREIELKQKLF
jgi:hypothetical protein